KNQGRPFIQIARDGCPMVKQAILFQDGKRIDGCHTSYQSRLNAIKHFKDGIYFYSGRFALYQNGDRFAEEPGYPVLLTNKRSGEPSPEALRNLVVETIEDLLKQNIKVVLVYPVPEMGFDVPKTFVKNYGSVSPLKLKQELETNPLSIKRIKFTQRTKKIVEAFDSIPNNTLLIRLDPAKVLCDQTKCYANDRNELFYYDDNHISPNAAQRLIDSIVPELRNRGWIE
ncbi:MAG: hypothetical protein MK188_15985, partial [Gammaproteobacteria bacterium]|nr:hypothetical protein [Gammaproteobacteria bacterium]